MTLKKKNYLVNPLYALVQHWASTPFEWGVSDCMLVVADYIEAITGKNPAAHLKYTYDSRTTLQKETGFFTDPVGVVSKLMEGFPEISEPKKGCCAVIKIDKDTVGAIYLGTCWAAKSPDGVTTINPNLVQVLKMWDVGYEA